jgi:acyl carrier protein
MAAFINDWQSYIRDVNLGQVNFVAEMLFIRGVYMRPSPSTNHHSMPHDPIEEWTANLIADEFRVDRTTISRNSKLKDFGRDSLAFLELLAVIENHFDISISDSEAVGISNLGSLVDLIKDRLDANQESV